MARMFSYFFLLSNFSSLLGQISSFDFKRYRCYLWFSFPSVEHSREKWLLCSYLMVKLLLYNYYLIIACACFLPKLVASCYSVPLMMLLPSYCFVAIALHLFQIGICVTLMVLNPRVGAARSAMAISVLSAKQSQLFFDNFIDYCRHRHHCHGHVALPQPHSSYSNSFLSLTSLYLL